MKVRDRAQKKERLRTEFSIKLKSCRGESIAEVLVAVLIVALSSIMLLTMVQSSSEIVKSSEAGMKKIYDHESAANGETWPSADPEITVRNNVGITLKQGDGGNASIPITKIAGKSIENDYKVNVFYDSYSGIVAFRKASGSSGAGTGAGAGSGADAGSGTDSGAGAGTDAGSGTGSAAGTGSETGTGTGSGS